MRVLVGLVIGLLLGFGLAIYAYPRWEQQSGATLLKADKTTQPSADSFYLCTTQYLKDPQPLIIKSVNGVARSIKFHWMGDEDLFTIEKTDDLNYAAFVRREDAGFLQIALNRVTGELNLANHPSNRSKLLLKDMCATRIPWSECKSRIIAFPGGRESECPFILNEYFCPRLDNLGLTNESRFQCTPTERRF
jgi:hypothetical protein